MSKKSFRYVAVLSGFAVSGKTCLKEFFGQCAFLPRCLGRRPAAPWISRLGEEALQEGVGLGRFAPDSYSPRACCVLDSWATSQCGLAGPRLARSNRFKIVIEAFQNRHWGLYNIATGALQNRSCNYGAFQKRHLGISRRAMRRFKIITRTFQNRH